MAPTSEECPSSSSETERFRSGPETSLGLPLRLQKPDFGDFWMSLITRKPKTLALWARLEKNRWGSREVTFQMTRIAAGKQMSPICVCWVRMLMTESQANKTQGCYQNCTSNLFTKKKNFNVLSLAGFIPRIPYAYQRGGWIFHAALFWFPLFASLGRCSSLPPLPLFFFFFCCFSFFPRQICKSASHLPVGVSGGRAIPAVHRLASRCHPSQ